MRRLIQLVLLLTPAACWGRCDLALSADDHVVYATQWRRAVISDPRYWNIPASWPQFNAPVIKRPLGRITPFAMASATFDLYTGGDDSTSYWGVDRTMRREHAKRIRKRQRYHPMHWSARDRDDVRALRQRAISGL